MIEVALIAVLTCAEAHQILDGIPTVSDRDNVPAHVELELRQTIIEAAPNCEFEDHHYGNV